MRHMDLKTYMIESTRLAAEDLFKTAREVPADKMDWRPLDKGRSVLDQLQECSQSPLWGATMLNTKKMPDFSPEMMEEFDRARKAHTTLEACHAECKKNQEILFDAIRNFPIEDLEKGLTLPFDGGREFKFHELMAIHRWNCNYHMGQISYIQTLYSDQQMSESNA